VNYNLETKSVQCSSQLQLHKNTSTVKYWKMIMPGVFNQQLHVTSTESLRVQAKLHVYKRSNKFSFPFVYKAFYTFAKMIT